MQLDPLLIGVMVLAATAGVLLGVVSQRRRPASQREWPRRWNLNARPIFTTDERILFKELRAALPNHVVLAKLNLLRFCQAADEFEARSWYDRLHTLHVSFAVCTPNGSVVSVIDIESPNKASSARSQRMKEAVLEACRVRYVRCRPGQWPHQALIAAWALGHSQIGPAPNTISDSLHDANDEVARKLRQRRAERAARWAESSFAQDSFFAFDSRLEGSLHTEPTPLQVSGKR
ncbi:DUF2726 domain-containing protein [Aquabacterium sp. CECT 9606]|uniref:DUF2726 domain-containing protein n=1 Tax=Aquabacterium sp. CECT 9606 TaxID=2845822 RepID=UPI001E5CDA52|nr:DUF2726 domain-containing protein [Aquabacterium sp. CECT 9606]CAH0348551.1 hypothetical protein AQB9606_00619 [Aquabacterium sp. CECT 9606]